MLQWADDYYVGEGIRDPEAIRKKLDRKKTAADIYLLTLSANSHNLLELVPALILKQKICYERCPRIIGMAKGKNGAIALLMELLEGCFQKQGDYNLKEYLRNR